MYLADCQFSGLAQPQKRPDQNAARLRALSEHKVNERFNWIDEEVDLVSLVLDILPLEYLTMPTF